MDDFNNKNQVIWTLRVKLPQIQSECVWVIEIKSTATFLQLHEAIQDAVDFDNDHLFDFFVGRYSGNRKYTIGGEANGDTLNPVRTYRNIRISSVWPLPTGMNLYYLFDFGDNWLFQINKTRHKDKLIQPGIVYPRVIEARGKNPEQYPDWDEGEE
jgi:hypothetical protein